MKDLIDCNVLCPFVLKLFNSCPSKPLFTGNSLLSYNYASLNLMLIEETVLILMSTLPYILTFVFLISTIIHKTSRLFGLLLLSIIQNFIAQLLKNIIKDPRPNFKCNRQYGNPSNHAIFFASMLAWIIMENIYLKKKYINNNKKYTFLLFTSLPLVIYARYKLNYHSIEQLLNGVIVGGIVGVLWFIIFFNCALKDNYNNPNIFYQNNILKSIMEKFGIINNMSDLDFIIFSKSKYTIENRILNKYRDLQKKQEEISKLKTEINLFKESIKNIEELNNVGNTALSRINKQCNMTEINSYNESKKIK